MKSKKRFYKFLSVLNDQIFNGIDFEKILEIRIVANRLTEIITDDKNYFVGSSPVSIEKINEIFSALCEYSVHAYKNEIIEGYITYEGGIRVGICGTAVYSEEKIYTIKDISALNIRIPHQIKGISKKIYPYIEKGGILIIGPPCSGKTTLLRDFSNFAGENFKTTIVDERMEIAGVFKGIPSFDVGNSTVLNGFIKSEGIKIAVRSMSPEIIICDEFGDEKDLSSAFFAMKSGVKIVASMHAFDKKDFISKVFVKKLLESEIFQTFIFINKNHEIFEILDIKDLLL